LPLFARRELLPADVARSALGEERSRSQR